MSSFSSMDEEAEAWRLAYVKAGHRPRLNPGSETLDICAYFEGYHNGPECITCREHHCMSCDSPEDVRRCSEPDTQADRITHLEQHIRAWEEWYESCVADFVGMTDNRDDPDRTHDWEFFDAHRPPPAPLSSLKNITET